MYLLNTVSVDFLRIFWLGVGFILGLCLGSFIKVLADRSLKGKTFRGRSYCAHCKYKLAWYDLLPVVSFLILGGKCRYCKKSFAAEHLLVEVLMGLIIGFLFWQTVNNFQFSTNNFQSFFNFKFSIFLLDLLFKIFFITVLAVLFITDLKKMFIPDRITFPALFITSVYLIAITGYKVGHLFYYLSQNRIGQLLLPPYSNYFQRHALDIAYSLLGSFAMAIAIGGFFRLLIIVTRGRGMGGGDVNLGALIGLALGLPNALVALMLSFISGAFLSIGLLVLRKKHFGQSIPFGPFLVFGSLVALIWGNQLFDWYLKLSVQ